VNLLSAAERLAAMDRSNIKLDTTCCLHTQDRYSTCKTCFDICPVGAIQPGKPPTLNLDKCQTCLACLPVCPTGAFQADDAVNGLLTCISRIETNRIELVCEQQKNAELGDETGTALRIKGCLAGLGSGVYLMLVALGIERIIVRLDACSNCEWANLRKQVELQVSQARQLLGMWGKSESLVCWSECMTNMPRSLWDAANPPLTRRDLFRMAAQQGKIAMARAMENKSANQEKNPGYNRRRLLGVVEHLAAPCVETPMQLHDFGFASLTVSDICTACGVCANVCPTQALHLEKVADDSSFALMFSARECIGCEACEHVCAPAAITIDHAPFFDQIFGKAEALAVHTGKLRRCSRCHTLIAERNGEELCALCEYRREHPFGSRLPPGIKK
jgi:ferredoxin